MARQTLLLVDSDLRSVRMLEVALRKAGYNVSMARHAAEALELIALDAPDLILSDTQLPPPDDAPVRADTPRDGYALCRKLKESERWRAIPFIFLTSSGELEDKIRGLELGVEDYLTKPIYLKELITRVQLVLARKQREGMTTSATASRASFSGDLADMGLVDLLTTIDMGRKTGLLEVHDGQSEGWVTFQDGRLLDAQYGRHRGERAVYRLLLWTTGRFELRFGPRALASRGESRTIEAPTQAVLLEGLRRVDEWHHLKEQLPPLGDPYDVVAEAPPERAASLPPEATGLLELVDGSRTLLEIVDASHHDDLASLHALSRLYFEGLIRPRSGAGARRSDDPGVSLLAPARPEPTDPFAALEALEVRDPSLTEAPSATVAPAVIATTPEALPPPIEGSSEGGDETAVPKTGGDTSQSASPALAAATSGVQDHGLPPAVSPQNRVTPETGRSEIVTSTAPGDRRREKHQERYVSKNKGKKAKGRPRESVPVSSGGPRGPAAGAAVQHVGAGATSSVAPSARTEAPVVPEKNLRVEGNVIHLPSASPSESATVSTAPESLSESPEPTSSEAPEARESESPDAVASSEAPGALVSEAPPAESGTTSVEAVREAVASLRADHDEAARTTVPPEERAEAKPESAPPKAEVAAETKPEAKPETKPEPAAKESPRDDARATKPDSKKPPSDARAAKPESAEGRPSKIDIVVPRKDELQRNRKESLSTHLSDEARAFFTEAAYQAAYKPDTFEDLQPEPEHAHEAARGKRMMTLIGGSLFLVLAILGGFALYQNYYGVHETSLNMPGSATTTQPLSPEQSTRPPEAPTPPPAPPENTPPPTTPENTPPPPAVVPAAVDDAGTSATPPAPPPTTPENTPPAVANTAADASTATTPPAPPPTEPAPTPAANPTGQTPAQLLAAVRAYHGPYAGMMTAYNAYFDAAPNDWQMMNSLAERIAEAHPADAESVARRAVTANPNNARGWFLLAFSRKVQGNRAGFREAHGRCIALGGQWAAECRALE